MKRLQADLGAWPVAGGLAVIAVVFGSLNEHFLSAENLTNLAAVRLELAKVDPRGRIKTGAGVSLVVPLDGPPTVECGAFIEAPNGRLQPA